MATYYVDSTAAGAGTGADWANAYLTLAAAFTARAAGDVFYVAHDHAETQGSAMTLTCPGTVAAPCLVICADSAGTVPPVAADLRTTATISTTGAFAITVTGTFYCYGITFVNGSTSTIAVTINSTSGMVQHYDNCSWQIGAGTTTGSRINVGQNSSINGTLTNFKNCTFKFASTGQRIYYGGAININGGSLASGTSAITNLFDTVAQRGNSMLLQNFDLSLAATGVVIFPGIAATGSAARHVMRNCKLPASWSGTLVVGALTVPGTSCELYNCAGGDTNYALWTESYTGSVRHEITIVRTGGASDGVTPISWNMVSGADAEFPIHVLRSPVFGKRIGAAGVGVSKTVTIPFIHDSLTNLKDSEVWLEVSYLGTSGFPLGVQIDDSPATVLTTAADQTTSAATWTTTGLTNPNEQQVAVTFTPQEAGYYLAQICLAKPSTTIYGDAKEY